MDAIKQKDRQTDCKMEVCSFFFFCAYHLIIMIYIFIVFHEAVLNYCRSGKNYYQNLTSACDLDFDRTYLKSYMHICISSCFPEHWHQFGENVRNHVLDEISEM